VKKYMPRVTKAIAVYDAALNCLTSAHKQNRNNYYILALQQDKLASVCVLSTLYTGACHWLTTAETEIFRKKRRKLL